MRFLFGSIAKRIVFSVVLVSFFYQIQISAQSSDWMNLDTIKAGKFDNGKMWTFEYPPMDYFSQAYNFQPDEAWFEHVRMSALRFANYCSASFVSADGLVMTNHHCARQSITQVTMEGEDLNANGFIAQTLQDERPVPGLYVDQLVLFKDVTDEVIDEINKGTTDKERAKFENEIISKIEEREATATGLEVAITPLYNGGKYSLYGYKRYTDVRLVLAPEDQLGFFGGDPDNFTYPRFNLDCSFFRVYDENGNPLKTENFYKWSENGAAVGEPVFVVGNPGNTDRLNTVAQLEYARDIQYPRTVALLTNLTDIYQEMLKKDPSRRLELQDMIFSFENSKKAIGGILDGLRNPVMMQRKKDFEKTFRASVEADPELKAKYGNLWDKIADSRKQLGEISNKNFALSMNQLSTPKYFFIADEVISIAENLKLPESERDELYVGDELNNTLASLFPEDFDADMANLLLEKKIDALYMYLGADDPLVKKFTGGKQGKEAVEYVLSNSKVTSLEDVKDLLEDGADEVLKGDDPFIYFMMNSKERAAGYSKKVNEIVEVESAYSQQLGVALFEVYGTSIPPDATFTLRLADGVVEGFPYNGTYAQPYTTFYGLYDRYYGQGKEFPWSLPAKWTPPPADFDLSTPFNFVSTNDIIGGNSGSPVINKNAEIVGLAFDGNIQGLPGSFIFRTEENRTVSVHSKGMYEAIDKVYKLKRLSAELKAGKITK
ncbi:MAG: S46 family peptidase [Ignavibacteriales bacterium]|nr:S46 family peptidase [Ignavibacteriales bacterium]MBP9119654.1 S46 family peptidase [Ignavibacterium sp.]